MEKKSFMQSSLESRKNLSTAQLLKCPNALPVVIIYAREWKAYKARPANQPFKFSKLKRFSITKTAKVFEAVMGIQNIWKLADKGTGIFVYSMTDLKLVNLNTVLAEVYEKSKSEDGWLYLLYDTEPVF